MNEKITILQKFRLLIKSSKQYKGPLLIGLLFISIGSFLVYFGFLFDVIFMIVFGGVFICFPLFVLLATMPSTILYYYEKELTKSYGKFTLAKLDKKESLDNSFSEASISFASTRIKKNVVNELNYLLTFSFEYRNQLFSNSDIVDKNTYEKLSVGDSIPIKFLTTDPKKSSIRIIKLKNSLRS